MDIIYLVIFQIVFFVIRNIIWNLVRIPYLKRVLNRF